MLISKRSLLAAFAAAQLPAINVASPLLSVGVTHGIDPVCAEGFAAGFGCAGLLSKAVDATVDGIVYSKTKRGIVPFIPEKPAPVPVSGPKLGPNAPDPVGGDLQPIVIKPKPSAEPVPTAGPEPTAAAPKPSPSSGPPPPDNDPASNLPPGDDTAPQPRPDDAVDDLTVETVPGDNTPQGPQSASQLDDANQPLGNPDSNSESFNGYLVSGSSKGFTKLDTSINSDLPDAQILRFDQPIEDPLNPGQTFAKYRPALLDPRPIGKEIRYDRVRIMGIIESRFRDPDVNLPTELIKPNGKMDPGAKWARLRIQSSKDETGVVAPEAIIGDVVEMGASKDGSAIIVAVTDASKDFNANLKDNVADILKKTPSSELIFQGTTLIRAADRPTSALRVIMRKTVNNAGTINTLKEVYRRNGLAENQKGVFRASAEKSTPEGQAFDALMQTKNVDVVNFMLADHHQAFGNKVIKKIVTFPDPTFTEPVGSDLKPTADIFLILGKK